MQKQEKNRAIIIRGHHAGRSNPEIIEFHKIKRSTLFSIKNKFDEFTASKGLPDFILCYQKLLSFDMTRATLL
jgi:hypothetical protein